MIKALLLAGALANVLHVTGQSEYKAWLIDTDTLLSKPIRLISTGDSSISIILLEKGIKDPMATTMAPVEFPVSGIRTLQFRHEKSMLKALAITVPLGLLVGVIAGQRPVETPNNPYAAAFGRRTEFKPASFAIAFGACVSIGLVIGSTRRNVHIDGRLSRYSRLRRSLDAYVEPL